MYHFPLHSFTESMVKTTNVKGQYIWLTSFVKIWCIMFLPLRSEDTIFSNHHTHP